ncbi:hypothetical protein GCM10022200_14970 [Microbacterium awajiense]|uniref:DUF4190 domain-containing protein n=1 Tax=Microbacterium awajiense TaxID=415214 RepID=A0ABP7AIN4_9MICO
MSDADTPRPREPEVVPPTPDVDVTADASQLPGSHRGGFSRLPTAPVPLTQRNDDLEGAPDVRWAEPAPPPSRGMAGWALGFSIVGLLVSMFVGWGFPIGLVAIVTAVIALRRPLESRAVAVWALVLGGVSLLYSAGWLVWAATRPEGLTG